MDNVINMAYEFQQRREQFLKDRERKMAAGAIGPMSEHFDAMEAELTAALERITEGSK